MPRRFCTRFTRDGQGNKPHLSGKIVILMAGCDDSSSDAREMLSINVLEMVRFTGCISKAVYLVIFISILMGDDSSSGATEILSLYCLR